MAEVSTVHRKEGGEQVTTYVVRAGAVTYQFEGEPTDDDVDELEYQGNGDPPAAATNALDEHFDDGEGGE